jgi:polyisoprenoid-binding protein YceI
MKIGAILGVSAAAAILIGSLGFAPQRENTAPKSGSTGSESFEIDSVHSSVVFKIQHMGIANFYGRFNDISGTYSIDAANPASSNFDIHVKTDSVDTKNAKRDGHLKSPDFFNAAEFPEIAFKSTKVSGEGNNLKVTGDLTLHGVTKPATVNLALFPAKQTPQGYKSGFETTFTIKRTDFDMDTYVAEGGLGDEVQITVAGEGLKR